MSKKLIAWVLLAGCLALAACGGQPAKAPEPTPAAQGDYSTILTPEPTPEPATEPAPESAASYEIIRTSAHAWSDSIGTPWVQVIIEVENTGTVPLYLGDGSADVETESGQLVKVVSGLGGYPEVLLPGERGVFYKGTTLDEAPDGELSVVPHISVVAAEVPASRLVTSDIAVSDGKYGGLKIMGRVENTGAEPVDDLVYIVGVCYNADGDCVAVVYTIITDEIPAGDKRGFEASEQSLPKSLTSEDIATVEVFAYPHQYQW